VLADAISALREEATRPVVVRHESGKVIELRMRGMPVLVFEIGDGAGRDVAIASLLRAKIRDVEIQALCGVSHGWVCKVRARLRAGGIEEVVRVRPSGRPRAISARMRGRLVTLKAEGKSGRAIARALAVAPSIVSRELQALESERAVQVEIDAAPSSANAWSEPAHAPIAQRAEDPPEEELVEKDPSSSEESPSAEAPGGEDGVAESAEQAGEDEDEATTSAELPGENDDASSPQEEELAPGAPLPSGPTEHPTRYAGLLLVVGALCALGIRKAFEASRVSRPKGAVYDATTTLFAMMSAWIAGFVSLESMHERDARALGVVLGLERSPSVRTLHRAVAQMRATFDPSAFSAEWIRSLAAATLPERLIFGVDGHFKTYTGEEPIDKGWDSKRRLATKGLAEVAIHDERGWTWSSVPVGAGDSLSSHVLAEARRLRAQLGDAQPIVLGFDRGGFAFDALDALDADDFCYVAYVPNTVKLPVLATIAPEHDGIGELAWTHPKLHHRARLLVLRDGKALVPTVTNLTTLVEAQDVVEVLRSCRGAQENAFKAARAHAHIDRLVDRGDATRARDDRPIDNPERARLKREVAGLLEREAALAAERATKDGRSRKAINDDRWRVGAERQLAQIELKRTPTSVPRIAIDPKAEKATLDTSNRRLLQPMKLATEGARRWLLATLHDGLVPTDKPHDADTAARTLTALLRAPGTVRFEHDAVHVTLDLPLAPEAHARLDAALRGITDRQFRFSDGRRRLVVGLAPRPTRGTLPHAKSTPN
jgi:hypothetical protein